MATPIPHNVTADPIVSRANLARGGAVLLAALLVGLLVLSGTRAAFTDTTRNDGNSWDTGLITLNDDAQAAMFSATGMVPGDVVTNSIEVTNDSTVASVDVRLYSENLADSDGLAEHLNLKVGTTSGGSDIYDGDVAGFAAAHTTFGNGADNWDGVAPEATRDYHFEVELDPSTPDAFQGASAEVDFVWEAHSNATKS
jgi:predicted ribosomally synthesized peptide with SipW-like signal peptide